MPPTTAQMKAFQPMKIPMSKLITSYVAPNMIPASAASDDPRVKVAMMIRFVGMPIRGTATLS